MKRIFPVIIALVCAVGIDFSIIEKVYAKTSSSNNTTKLVVVQDYKIRLFRKISG